MKHGVHDLVQWNVNDSNIDDSFTESLEWQIFYYLFRDSLGKFSYFITKMKFVRTH